MMQGCTTEEKHQMFTALYSEYAQKVRNYACMFIDEPCRADDIMQDVFMKVWTKFEQFQFVNEPLCYLFIMTKNHCLNQNKERLKKRNALTKYSWSLAGLDGGDFLIQKECSRIFSQAVQQLPQRQKEIFILKEEMEMKRRKIATCLNISPKTIDNSMVMARKSIEAYLKERLDMPVTEYKLSSVKVNADKKTWRIAA